MQRDLLVATGNTIKVPPTRRAKLEGQRLQPAASRVQSTAKLTCQTMLDAAEPLQGAHALVICPAGPAGLDALCGLIGRGCDTAVHLSPDGRVAPEPAEIVLVPAVANLDQAVQAVSVARRSLLPCGRMVIWDMTGTLASAIARLLRISGFSSVCIRGIAKGVLILADWPMFGPRPMVTGHA